MAQFWYVKAVQKGMVLKTPAKHAGLDGLKIGGEGQKIEQRTKSLLGMVDGLVDLAKDCAVSLYPLDQTNVRQAERLSIILDNEKSRPINYAIEHSKMEAPINFVVIETTDKPYQSEIKPGSQNAQFVASVRLYANCYYKPEFGALSCAAAAHDDANLEQEPFWYVFGTDGRAYSGGEKTKDFEAFRAEWEKALKKD